MSGSDMIIEKVSPADLAGHKSRFLADGFELRDERVLSDGRILLTWRPTCCGGDGRQR